MKILMSWIWQAVAKIYKFQKGTVVFFYSRHNVWRRLLTGAMVSTIITASVCIAADRALLAGRPDVFPLSRDADPNLAFKNALQTTFYSGRPLENLNLLEMNRGQVLREALNRNPDIKNVMLSRHVSAASLEGAKSQFDPVISQVLSDNRSQVFDRVVKDMEYKSTVTCVNPDAEDKVDKQCIKIIAPNPGVYSMWYDQVRPQGYYLTSIYASESPKTGMDNSQKYNVQASKQFPSGISGFLSNSLTRKDYVYIESYGFDLIGSYDRQWTNNMTLGLSTPLPMTRYFGEFAPVDMSIKVADFNQVATFWNMQGAVNNIIGRVEQAYWNLLLAYKRYQVTLAAKERLALQMNKTRRMFDLQEATRYDKSVVEAQFSSLVRQESEVLNDFLLASNVLVGYLDYELDVVILPLEEGISSGVRAIDEIQDLLKDGLLYNPQIQAARVNVGVATMLRDQAVWMQKPDVSFNVVFNSNQSNAVYGFHSPFEAMGKTTNPDSTTQSYSIIYNRQWDNLFAKAALENSESQLRQQELMVAQARRSVAGQIVVAVANLQNMDERVALAKQALEMAKSVFDRAEKQRALGVISDFELSVKIQEVRNAELTYEAMLVSRGIAAGELRVASGAAWRADRINGGVP